MGLNPFAGFAEVGFLNLGRCDEMFNRIIGLWSDETGQGMVEYGLIIALVAIVVITVLSTMGTKLTNTFTKISNELPTQ